MGVQAGQRAVHEIGFVLLPEMASGQKVTGSNLTYITMVNVKGARVLYQSMFLFVSSIPADIRDAAFCIGVKHGDSEVWNNVLDVYVRSESASERQSAQLALACSKDQIQLLK